MAGLMNSGMITIGMTIPRPRNGRTIATASSSPSTSSSATTAGVCRFGTMDERPMAARLRQLHAQPHRGDGVIGVGAGQLHELLVGVALLLHAELLRDGVPLGGGPLQGGLRILARPHRGAH